nr:GAMYB transcription factor [Ipomoea batatas]
MGTDLNTESAIKALQKSVKALELQFDKIETLSTTVSSLSITSHNHAIALANLEKLVKQLLTQAGANANISPGNPIHPPAAKTSFVGTQSHNHLCQQQDSAMVAQSPGALGPSKAQLPPTKPPTKTTLSLDSMVKETAVVVGTCIATPSDVASLLKAAQSMNVVLIPPGGGDPRMVTNRLLSSLSITSHNHAIALANLEKLFKQLLTQAGANANISPSNPIHPPAAETSFVGTQSHNHLCQQQDSAMVAQSPGALGPSKAQLPPTKPPTKKTLSSDSMVKETAAVVGTYIATPSDVASLLKAAQSMNVVFIPPGGGDPVDKPPAVGANTLPRHNCRHLFMLWTLEDAIKALQKSVKALELQFDKIETLSTTVSSLSITSHNHAIALANLEKLVKQLLTQAGANANISPGALGPSKAQLPPTKPPTKTTLSSDSMVKETAAVVGTYIATPSDVASLLKAAQSMNVVLIPPGGGDPVDKPPAFDKIETLSTTVSSLSITSHNHAIALANLEKLVKQLLTQAGANTNISPGYPIHPPAAETSFVGTQSHNHLCQQQDSAMVAQSPGALGPSKAQLPPTKPPTKTTLSSDSMVKETAVVVGTCIATPSDVASLLKAAQSMNVVLIPLGGGDPVDKPPAVGANTLPRHNCRHLFML